MNAAKHMGHGVGLRPPHFGGIVDGTAKSDWFEVISENFMIRGGRPLSILEKAREAVPVVLHGVSMNLGGTDPLNQDYLQELDRLAKRFEPAWISDHLCWGAFGRHYAHDLLPLPYTREAIKHVAERIRRVQEYLGRQILIENISSYLTYRHSEMPEWTFLGAVVSEADCHILLDINNLYVNSVNHGLDPIAYLDGVPRERVRQIHLAGHTNAGLLLIDTHDHSVPQPVWDLYREVVARFGAIPTLIEWDDHIPPFETLLAEAERARAIETQVLLGCSAAA